jgi:MtN3 and saliva related transmembrane protein
MKIMSVEAIGFFAAALTTGSFIPGAVKIWRNHPTPSGGVSLPMFTMMTVGLFVWILYGVLKASPSICVANVIAFPFALAILIYKIKYG